MKIDATLFKIPASTVDVQGGTLLVAEPLLGEPHFQRAVVCVIEHTTQQGSLGLVLNKPIGCYLDELVDITTTHKIEVFCGGPVDENRLFFIHTLGSLISNSIPLGNDLYIGGDFDAMIAYVNRGYEVEDKVRFFLGYSGWSYEQLQHEVAEGVWVIAPESVAQHHLIGKGDLYWRNIVKNQGEEYHSWLTYPKSPSYN